MIPSLTASPPSQSPSDAFPLSQPCLLLQSFSDASPFPSPTFFLPHSHNFARFPSLSPAFSLICSAMLPLALSPAFFSQLLNHAFPLSALPSTPLTLSHFPSLSVPPLNQSIRRPLSISLAFSPNHSLFFWCPLSPGLAFSLNYSLCPAYPLSPTFFSLNHSVPLSIS